MNPWQLAKSGTEHGEQTALFCFTAKAQSYGFPLAFQQASYEAGNIDILKATGIAVPDLKWFHAIPNGGNRGDNAKSRAIEGGRMKAEGVKSGVLDCFWPLQRADYNGIYIEMKKSTLKVDKNPTAGCSEEQKDFGQFVIDNGYYAIVCYSWLEAAKVLEWYYNLV